MPRIENGGDVVTEWSRATAQPSSTFDICAGCAGELEYGDPLPLRLTPQGGHEPRGLIFCFDVDHPPYEGETYTCELCSQPLTADDD